MQLFWFDLNSLSLFYCLNNHSDRHQYFSESEFEQHIQSNQFGLNWKIEFDVLKLDKVLGSNYLCYILLTKYVNSLYIIGVIHFKNIFCYRLKLSRLNLNLRLDIHGRNILWCCTKIAQVYDESWWGIEHFSSWTKVTL